MTIKNKYSLPLINELIDTLPNIKYFTKLDVWWKYNNIYIKERWIYLLNKLWTFWTSCHVFQTNSPATFQTMINNIFHIKISQKHILIYLDSIFIFDKDFNTHYKHVQQVMKHFQKHKLYLKPEKYEFNQSQIEYFRVIVGNKWTLSKFKEFPNNLFPPTSSFNQKYSC